jgi:transcriptional regulator with XRE-family HTH domain
MPELDLGILAGELLRAMRGKRSQRAFSRRLGYRTNIAYTWESGRSFPTAARAFAVAERAGIDTAAAVARFFGAPPAWLGRAPLTTTEGVVALLRELRGGQAIVEIAERSGRSRFAVARWLQGGAEPRLPDFLRLVDVCSLRLLDFLAALVDPRALPSARAAWTQLETRRRAAYEVPWSQAVLLALELRAYEELPRHRDGWIAARIGIGAEEERACLALLERTGQIRMVRRKYAIVPSRTVDTRRDPRAAQRVKVWWSQRAVERLDAGAPGPSSYNLFTVSAADLERLRELHRSYFQQMRAIVAASQPCERLVLACAQMLDLSVEPDAPGVSGGSPGAA